MEKDHLAILLEDMNGKFDLVLEGHDALRQKTLNEKVDAVAADLAAHRKDTEAHGVKWSVREKNE